VFNATPNVRTAPDCQTGVASSRLRARHSSPPDRFEMTCANGTSIEAPARRRAFAVRWSSQYLSSIMKSQYETGTTACRKYTA